MNDDELHFAPVGRYMLAFDENGNLQTLDTLGAGNTVTIPLPSENITPELFVTPYGSKALVDDAGNLDNGISKLRNYLKSVKDPIQRQIIMKNINRFSVGILGMYGIKQLANNIGNGEIQ